MTEDCRAKAYDPDDVTTWTNEEFEAKTAAKLRNYWNKIETVKFLLRDGKVWIAGEQLQGLSDGIGFLVGLLEQRIENGESSKTNASNCH